MNKRNVVTSGNPCKDKTNPCLTNRITNDALQEAWSDLKGLSSRLKSNEPWAHSFSSSDLLQEAMLTVGLGEYKNRPYLFGASKKAMRRVLINRGRRRQTLKRGSAFHRVDVGAAEKVGSQGAFEVAEFEIACGQLAKVDLLASQVVRLRVLERRTLCEIAQCLKCSESTVGRRWSRARAWLKKALTDPA